MIEWESTEDRFWKNSKKGLMTASVIFNILILSYIGGALARRLGVIEVKKPVAAKEGAESSKRVMNWPKRNKSIPVLSFEQVKRNAEAHPQARRFVSVAVKKEYPLDWNFSLHYRPVDSAFFYLVELSAERCDCEGSPFAKIGLRLLLNPYEDGVFFVDTLKNVPSAWAIKD